MDIKQKFLDMTSMTYPHPLEDSASEFLPDDVQKDEYGNYYYIVDGDDKTMFTSHIDTADYGENKVVTHTFEEDENGDTIVGTDGTTVLGADDKAGTAIMLYMIDKGVPGIYYFFIGEERGMIGSKQVARNFQDNDIVSNVKRVISFDRMAYTSIISRQMGDDCCSLDFINYLISQYDDQGMTMKSDPGGSFTDSAAFMDIVPECTNISVGYFRQHSPYEIQNLDFLERIAEASSNVDWSNTPVARKIGIDEELLERHSDVIKSIKDAGFTGSKMKITEEFNNIVINVLMDGSANEIVDDIATLEEIISEEDYYTEIIANRYKIFLQ